MTSFRLARLLALREEQAKAEKIRWAQAQRAARDAADQRDAGRERVRDARRSLATSHETDDASPGRSVQSTLAAYEVLDALTARTASDDAKLQEANARAAEARQPYDLRRRDVEALKRLEQRWLQEQRRQRRRKEDREREAFINSRFTADPTDPQAHTHDSLDSAP